MKDSEPMYQTYGVSRVDTSNFCCWTPDVTNLPTSLQSLGVGTVFIPVDEPNIASVEDYQFLLAKRLEFHIDQWVNDFVDEMAVTDPTPDRIYQATLSMMGEILEPAMTDGVLSPDNSPFDNALVIAQKLRLGHLLLGLLSQDDSSSIFPIESVHFIHGEIVLLETFRALYEDRNLEEYLKQIVSIFRKNNSG